MINKNNIITSAAVLLVSTLLIPAQVAVGKGLVQNSSISLEFGNENRGMIRRIFVPPASPTRIRLQFLGTEHIPAHDECAGTGQRLSLGLVLFGLLELPAME